MVDVNVTLANNINSIRKNTLSSEANSEQFNVMQILQLMIVSVGITANLTVIVVFLNHKELRRKIPNRFIVNQVSFLINGVIWKKNTSIYH